MHAPCTLTDHADWPPTPSATAAAALRQQYYGQQSSLLSPTVPGGATGSTPQSSSSADAVNRLLALQAAAVNSRSAAGLAHHPLLSPSQLYSTLYMNTMNQNRQYFDAYSRLRQSYMPSNSSTTPFTAAGLMAPGTGAASSSSMAAAASLCRSLSESSEAGAQFRWPARLAAASGGGDYASQLEAINKAASMATTQSPIPRPSALHNNPSSSQPSPYYPSHFMRGTIIQLASGELKRVEELAADDFIQSAHASHDLRMDSSTVVRIEQKSADSVLLCFSVGEHKVQVSD